MRRDLLLVCRILCACSAVAASSTISYAQVPEAAPPQKDGGSADKKSGDIPLSKKLDQSEGVLKPPHGVDPQMHQTPPANTGDKMPVIIPPGEPGGDQSIQPK